MAKTLSILLVVASVAGRLTSNPDNRLVAGHVRDESGAAIRGAQVECPLPSGSKLSTLTDDGGAFSLDIPATRQVSIIASHPDFGVQWTAGFAAVSHYGLGTGTLVQVPARPVELVLRKGIIFHGRARDTRGEPYALQDIFLVPAYVGSGQVDSQPRPTRVGTFHLRGLSQLALRARSASARSVEPAKPGHYVRVAQSPDAWLEAAQSGKPIDLRVESYTLVPVTLNVAALRTRTVEVWTRRAGKTEWATTLDPDESGRIQVVMEEGAPYELWAFPGVNGRLSSPSRAGRRANWTGTPIGPVAINITRPPRNSERPDGGLLQVHSLHANRSPLQPGFPRAEK